MARTTTFSKVTALLLIPLAVTGCDMAMPYRNAPISQGQGAEARCPAQMTVERGDTVYSLSRRCGVSVRALIETNSLQAPYELAPGTVLRMPGAMTEIVVVRGDTLSKLARKYRVDFQSLAQANNKSPPYTIRVGEHLRLPDAYGQAAPPPAAPQWQQQPAGQQPAGQPQGSPQGTGQQGGTTVAVINAQPAAPPPPRPATDGGGGASGGAASLPDMAMPPPPRPADETAAAVPQSAPQPPPPQSPSASAKGFIWPVKGDVILAYGPQSGKGQSSDGINIAAPKGTPFRAIESGVVAYVGNELKGFGNLILIKHADGWVSAYAHADQVLVKKGEIVRKGQELGTVGQTGSVSQPQLHFELRRQNEAVDPQEYLPG